MKKRRKVIPKVARCGTVYVEGDAMLLATLAAQVIAEARARGGWRQRPGGAFGFAGLDATTSTAMLACEVATRAAKRAGVADPVAADPFTRACFNLARAAHYAALAD